MAEDRISALGIKSARPNDRPRKFRQVLAMYGDISPKRYSLKRCHIRAIAVSTTVACISPRSYAAIRLSISAAHPGGGVMGACGKNAATEILRDG